MKFVDVEPKLNDDGVAPLAGAWIEMLYILIQYRYKSVAPLAGAWIEIDEKIQNGRTPRVAPLAGAWIEIL